MSQSFIKDKTWFCQPSPSHCAGSHVTVFTQMQRSTLLCTAHYTSSNVIYTSSYRAIFLWLIMPSRRLKLRFCFAASLCKRRVFKMFRVSKIIFWRLWPSFICSYLKRGAISLSNFGFPVYLDIVISINTSKPSLCTKKALANLNVPSREGTSTKNANKVRSHFASYFLFLYSFCISYSPSQATIQTKLEGWYLLCVELGMTSSFFLLAWGFTLRHSLYPILFHWSTLAAPKSLQLYTFYLGMIHNCRKCKLWTQSHIE